MIVRDEKHEKMLSYVLNFRVGRKLSRTVDNGIVAITQHNENELSVTCEGICNCYADEDFFFDEEGYGDISRRFGTLVYSHRYLSTFVVSVLALALPKFVSYHIEHCYNQARKNYEFYDEYEEYYEETEDFRTYTYTCTLESGDCQSATERENRSKDKIIRVYECTGHCMNKRVTPNRYQQEAAQVAMKNMDCKNQWTESKIIEVTKNDNWATTHIPKADSSSSQDYVTHHYHQVALLKFRKYFLVPFCASFETEYEYLRPFGGGYSIYIPIKPCSASHKAEVDHDRSNIKCRQVKEIWR